MASQDKDLDVLTTGTHGDRAAYDARTMGVRVPSSVSGNVEEVPIEPRRGDSQNDAGQKGVRSLFSEYHVIRGAGKNYPVLEKDENVAESKRISTVSELIQNPEGARIYKAGDFVYCARHGLSVNRMITLRRFPFPAMNDITLKENSPTPDFARMVTYMDNDINPVSEVCKISWALPWKALSSSIDTPTAVGDSKGINGFMGKIAEYIDPDLTTAKLQGENVVGYDPYHDQNKVYGPVDSIRKTHIYGSDEGLVSEPEFQITFDYELRSINGINQKHAFIDLLSNILACTYNDATFWGGAYNWKGLRPSKFALTKLRQLNGKNLEDFLGNAQGLLKNTVSQFSGPGGGKKAIEVLKQIATNALTGLVGGWLDKLGRASYFQMNSLLTGEPVGNWHLTIGNPLNPIMRIGNLMCTNTEFKFDENSFGYDDLPEKFSVVVTLKSAMPLDRAGIEALFSIDPGRIYFKPTTLLEVTNQASSGKSLGGSFGDYDKSAVNEVIDNCFYFLNKTKSDSSITKSTHQWNQPENLREETFGGPTGSSSQNHTSNIDIDIPFGF